MFVFFKPGTSLIPWDYHIHQFFYGIALLCIAVRGDRVRCVLMSGKAKRMVRLFRVRKEMATAAHIYYAVKPLVKREDVILIDAEYDPAYLRRVRKYLEKTLDVSSVAIGSVSERAIERADKLSKAFRKQKHYDEKDPNILVFVKMIHPVRGACFTP